MLKMRKPSVCAEKSKNTLSSPSPMRLQPQLIISPEKFHHRVLLLVVVLLLFQTLSFHITIKFYSAKEVMIIFMLSHPFIGG